MPEPLRLRLGEYVWIMFHRRTAIGRVVLASEDGRSLMLGFDGMLAGYLGAMPILWDDGVGGYIDLIQSAPVVVSRFDHNQEEPR
jgi:hypothetical protein